MNFFKNNLKLFNTHVFEPNILEKFSPSSADGSWIATDWSTSGEIFGSKNMSVVEQFLNYF